MSYQSLGRSLDLRSVRWPTWILLGLALLYSVYRLTLASSPILDVLVGCAPLVFAAAVVQVAPDDRRFVWGALALAVAPTVRLAAALIPGDWLATAPVLLDISGVALDVGRMLLFVGVALLGVAIGGVRSAFGVAVVGAGVLIGLTEVGWVLSHQTADLSPLDVGRSIAFGALTALAWAFLVAAAIDWLRSLMIIGAGLLLVVVAIDAALLVWPYGPDTNFELVGLVVSGVSIAGWLVMIGAALRGELNVARPMPSVRSRVRQNRR